MANVATFYQNQAIKAAREAEVPLANFDDGVNKGGSNTPGVGIGTAAGQNDTQLWSVADQFGNARDPQFSQHIVQVASGINVFDEINTDYNDTVSLTVEATGWVRNAVA